MIESLRIPHNLTEFTINIREIMAKQPEGKPKNDKSAATKTLKEKRAVKAAKKESKKKD